MGVIYDYTHDPWIESRWGRVRVKVVGVNFFSLRVGENP
jgi:hypothetical protein